jgi:hypothetical protein
MCTFSFIGKGNVRTWVSVRVIVSVMFRFLVRIVPRIMVRVLFILGLDYWLELVLF